MTCTTKTLHQIDVVYLKPAKRHILIDEDCSDINDMARPNIINPAFLSNDMESFQMQFSQLDMDAQKQLQRPTPDQSISKAALAANWVRIFEHHYPSHKHVLSPYRDSDERMINFIRGWFAFYDLEGVQHLDPIASDPHLGTFYDALVNRATDTTEQTLDLEYPSKVYSSFEDWFSDPEKPEGWIFDEETQHLVPYTKWLTSKDVGAQTVEETNSRQSEHDGDDATKWADSEFSDQFEQMHIDNTID